MSLVTGSTSGIGLGIARALAAAGSAVVLNGFGKPEDIAEAQAKIVSEFGVKARYSPADMSKAAPIADMIAMTLDAFGRLDVLVNNAGIQHVAPMSNSRSRSGTRSSPSTCRRRSIPRARRCLDGRTTSAASSTSPRRTAWSLRRSRRPMSPPSTASSASPR